MPPLESAPDAHREEVGPAKMEESGTRTANGHGDACFQPAGVQGQRSHGFSQACSTSYFLLMRSWEGCVYPSRPLGSKSPS